MIRANRFARIIRRIARATKVRPIWALSREAPVRFGSVTVWRWNGSSGSGFRFRFGSSAKRVFFFSVFQYTVTGKDGSGSGFGSWKTVPAVAFGFGKNGSDGSGFRFRFGPFLSHPVLARRKLALVDRVVLLVSLKSWVWGSSAHA